MNKKRKRYIENKGDENDSINELIDKTRNLEKSTNVDHSSLPPLEKTEDEEVKNRYKKSKVDVIQIKLPTTNSVSANTRIIPNTKKRKRYDDTDSDEDEQPITETKMMVIDQEKKPVKKKNKFGDTEEDEEMFTKLAKRRKSKLLKDRYPEIFAQIHPTKNKGIDLGKLTCGSHVYLWWKCPSLKCNCEWLAVIYSRAKTNSPGCPKCSRNMKKTHDQFVQDANLINDNAYDYIGKYINDTTPILIQHIIDRCGFKFLQIPSNHLQGNGCPKCGGTMKKTHREFVNDANLKKENKFDYIGKYINAKSPMLMRHNIPGCKLKFLQRPDDHLRGAGCPKCASGHFARDFAQLLKKRHTNFTPEKRFPNCRDKAELPVDFDVHDLNTLAELDGPQHFKVVYWYNSKGSDLEKQQLHDSIKNKFARDNNKHMFRLSYSEKKNMETHWKEFVELVKAAGNGPDRPRIERFYGQEYKGNQGSL